MVESFKRLVIKANYKSLINILSWGTIRQRTSHWNFRGLFIIWKSSARTSSQDKKLNIYPSLQRSKLDLYVMLSKGQVETVETVWSRDLVYFGQYSLMFVMIRCVCIAVESLLSE